jgi:hypothetical protein
MGLPPQSLSSPYQLLNLAMTEHWRRHKLNQANLRRRILIMVLLVLAAPRTTGLTLELRGRPPRGVGKA